MWVATAGETCLARARLVYAAGVRLAKRPAPVTGAGDCIG